MGELSYDYLRTLKKIVIKEFEDLYNDLLGGATMRKLNLLVNKIYPSSLNSLMSIKIDNYTFIEIQIRIRKLNSLVEHFSNMSFIRNIGSRFKSCRQ